MEGGRDKVQEDMRERIGDRSREGERERMGRGRSIDMSEGESDGSRDRDMMD